MEQQHRKKVAYVASVYRHFAVFHLPILRFLQAQGYEVHVYANADHEKQRVVELGVICHDIPFERSPFRSENIACLKQLLVSFKEEGFEMVHVHTPVASILGRLAARLARVPNVVYTAHGFHFFEGGPLVNWLVYYPIEWLFSLLSDRIITINKEDYQVATRFPFAKKKIFSLPGMGVDVEKFQVLNKVKIRDDVRNELGIPLHAQLILTAAEINENKNQTHVIRSMPALLREIPNLHYVLVGSGEAEDAYKHDAERLGVAKNVHFLGYRKDVHRYMAASDLYVLTSKREGLGMATIEAMASGLPVINTNTVGGRTLLETGRNGFLIPHHDSQALEEAVITILTNADLAQWMSDMNREKAMEYSKENSLSRIGDIYADFLDGIAAPQSVPALMHVQN